MGGVEGPRTSEAGARAWTLTTSREEQAAPPPSSSWASRLLSSVEEWQVGHLLRPGEGGAGTGTELNGLSVGTQPEKQMAQGPPAGEGADRGQASLLPLPSHRVLYPWERRPLTAARKEQI